MKDNLPILEIKALGGFSIEIWRENDFNWQWEIDKGSEAFADSGMQ